jgi:hypothetical protein
MQLIIEHSYNYETIKPKTTSPQTLKPNTKRKTSFVLEKKKKTIGDPIIIPYST